MRSYRTNEIPATDWWVPDLRDRDTTSSVRLFRRNSYADVGGSVTEEEADATRSNEVAR